MKRNLLPEVAVFLTGVMTSMLLQPPERLGVKTPFGPCASVEFIDMGFWPIEGVLPNDEGRYDLSKPCIGAS